MPLGSYTSAAFTTATGVAVAAQADIEVRREDTSALASIFSDRAGTLAITQPGFQADSEGRFTFFAAGISGGYQVKVTKGAETFTARFQATGTAQELDADPFWAGVLAAATKLAARIALKALGLDGITSRATNTILAAADSGKAIVATGSFTQTFDAAATLGADWHVHYRVNAGQTVTLDPNAAELIDGAATKVVVGPAAGTIVCDGSAFYSFGLAFSDGEYRNMQVFTGSGTWNKTAVLKRAKVTVIGGGGGGGGVQATGAGQTASAGGGGGGGTSIKVIETASLGATEDVTVGAAGAAGLAGADGGAGGTSSFGAHCTATGGLGGVTGNNVATTSPNGSGGDGGGGSSGDINLKGTAGGYGIGFADTGQALGGEGGSSALGGGGLQRADTLSNGGSAGGAFGGGASGAASGASQVARSGVAGSAGVVIVEEFF